MSTENTPTAPTETAPAAPAETSPFAAPASPFAAPAGTSATAATGAEAAGDTSFLDNVTAREPLVKSCIVPGIVAAIAVKTSATSGNSFLSITVALFGEKMVFENGDPVAQGKRLSSTWFASSKTEDGLKFTGRKLKNLLLALHNVPIDGKEDATYAAWPPAEKIARASFDTLSLSAFEPTSKWENTKVLVDVRVGKDMDGNPRNEFNLLAASTKVQERKGRK